MARRRESLADLLNPGQETVSSGTGETPAAVKLPVARCAPNPHNPRRSLGDLSDLADLPRRQLQSVLAVTRGAYLQLWPEESEQLRGIDHVIVNGCRRHAASLKYGRTELTAIVDDSVAASRASLLRAAFDENNSRKDFDPIEEAEAVKAIVSEYPSQAEACREQGWDKTWCSQRLSLLSLAPDVQDSVRSRAAGGEGMALREARWLAGRPNLDQLSAAEQFAAVEARRAEEQAAKAVAKQQKVEERRQAKSDSSSARPAAEAAKQSSRPADATESYTAVYDVESEPESGPAVEAASGASESAAAGEAYTAVYAEDRPEGAIPDQRSEDPSAAVTAFDLAALADREPEEVALLLLESWPPIKLIRMMELVSEDLRLSDRAAG